MYIEGAIRNAILMSVCLATLGGCASPPPKPSPPAVAKLPFKMASNGRSEALSAALQLPTEQDVVVYGHISGRHADQSKANFSLRGMLSVDGVPCSNVVRSASNVAPASAGDVLPLQVSCAFHALAGQRRDISFTISKEENAEVVEAELNLADGEDVATDYVSLQGTSGWGTVELVTGAMFYVDGEGRGATDATGRVFSNHFRVNALVVGTAGRTCINSTSYDPATSPSFRGCPLQLPARATGRIDMWQDVANASDTSGVVHARLIRRIPAPDQSSESTAHHE